MTKIKDLPYPCNNAAWSPRETGTSSLTAALPNGPRQPEGPSMPRIPSLALPPPRYRRHAIARLDAVIALAERERAEQRQAVERSPERGGAKAKLRLVEYRLGLLHGSRRLLTSGKPS